VGFFLLTDNFCILGQFSDLASENCQLLASLASVLKNLSTPLNVCLLFLFLGAGYYTDLPASPTNKDEEFVHWAINKAVCTQYNSHHICQTLGPNWCTSQDRDRLIWVRDNSTAVAPPAYHKEVNTVA
jgi:hypothetical protein